MNTALIDLPALLHTSLAHMGCPLDRLSEVHQHSPIAMEFSDTSEIFLSADDSDVWLYSQIRLSSPSIIHVHSDEFLRATLQPREWARGGALTAFVREGELQLNVTIVEAFLGDTERFSFALEEFYKEVSALYSVLA